ncbi:hypothetical protein DICVIV_10037 [Dictyocaulus viviparus]|uniref:S-methyl-5-thioribose-1-phosphate isomerase n=1 Tax=Dictyocaulus viviparus TaxID=29172 RepID=A0A0D8XH72_DICVI|nr:hypothetical protein DICVIV_10037 [Dictyocaulus viviparus]
MKILIVEAPVTSINMSRKSGNEIPIEERSVDEILSIGGVYVGTKETPAWNPAFDVTPAELITKIITDRGNFVPQCLDVDRLA